MKAARFQAWNQGGTSERCWSIIEYRTPGSLDGRTVAENMTHADAGGIACLLNAEFPATPRSVVVVARPSPTDPSARSV